VKNFNKKFLFTSSAVAVAIWATVGITACSPTKPAAQTANDNLSTKADNFEIQRKIVGINGITNTIAFSVEGRCSINDQGHQLEVTCKHGPDDFRKHMVGISDNTFYVAEQLDGVDVSQYHTEIIIRPEAIIPGIRLDAGTQ
jgi:hypothetical protein